MTLNFGEKKPVNKQVGVGKVKFNLLHNNLNALVQAIGRIRMGGFTPVSLLPLGHHLFLGM